MKPLFSGAIALLSIAIAASGANAQSLAPASASPASLSLNFSSLDSSSPASASLDFSSRDSSSRDFSAISNGLQLNRTKDDHDPAWADFASGPGTLLFVGAGTLLPLATDGKDGAQHTLRTADALIVSTLLAEGLKQITREKRPDGSDTKSFPSGHATAAFTVATMQAYYHPKQALYWYGGAALIGASRVALDRHYTHDVLAGAALGYFTARLELNQNRGLLLRPFIRQSAPDNRVAGLSFSGSF